MSIPMTIKVVRIDKTKVWGYTLGREYLGIIPDEIDRINPQLLTDWEVSCRLIDVKIDSLNLKMCEQIYNLEKKTNLLL